MSQLEVLQKFRKDGKLEVPEAVKSRWEMKQKKKNGKEESKGFRI